MAQIFALNPALMFALFAAFGLVTYLLAVGALGWFGRGAPVAAAAMPVPNFAATITTAWALALGFAAADIWTANSQARLAAAEERSAIARMIGISGSDMLTRPGMVSSLRAYKEAVAGAEWGELRNGRPHESVDAAIEVLIRTRSSPSFRTPQPGCRGRKSSDGFRTSLQDSRSARSGARGREPGAKRTTMVSSAVPDRASQGLPLAAVHADRNAGGAPRAGDLQHRPPAVSLLDPRR